jgi:hypothetical protein
MKPTRILATASLIISSVALITAARTSVGDEPGVVRMSSFAPQAGAASVPTPDPAGSGAVMTGAPMAQGVYPQPSPYAPYFERSMAATEVVPNVFYAPEQPFGPILMFESNFDQGLGFNKGYQRLNARVPYHILNNQTVLIGDLSASVTNNGDPLGNAGLVYRNYDEARNRVFGWNIFGDYDQGHGNTEWYRLTAGFESLGKYIDWRANGYFVLGDDTTLLGSTLADDLALSGVNAFKVRTETRENAYSGFDLETGGPLPYLGRYGLNMFAGVYFLGNDSGYDTTGFQARWEALITQSLRVNTMLTTDDTFGTNSWVSLQYDLPNYKDQKVFRPRVVRERLQDPVVRANRIHTNIDAVIRPEALINPDTGLAYRFIHVNPDATLAGNGSFESPFNTLQLANAANNAAVDVIRVQPRDDDSGTNLTAPGGFSLFDNQILMSSLKELAFAPDCIVPADSSTTGLGPLISNPTMVAGGSVVHLANNNTVLGMRIDASNTAGTIFGNGVSNALPITDVNLTMNTFLNYETGANLQDVTGDVIIDMNTFDGLLGASQNGLDLTIAGGSTANVLVRDNVANDNSDTGLKIVAQAGSTLNADDPDNSTSPTGIIGNVASGNGTGIRVEGQTGAVVNAVIEGNTAEDNTFDGIQMVADGSTFNLASLAENVTNDNLGNGLFIHYLNGGTFTAVSEDLDGDGALDPGEDLNGNGRMDQGIVTNISNDNGIAGLCIFGEDASTGVFDIGGPTEDLGNTFIGNEAGGQLTDLRDSATAQIDAIFNTIAGGSGGVPGLTIVLDFIDPGQASEVDINGFTVSTFDVTAFGFNQSQYDVVTNAILQTIESHYKDLPTSVENPLSPILAGTELDIDFVIGDTGVAPSNGATEYYVLTIGSSADAFAGLAGLAGDIGNIRNAAGQGPGLGLQGTPQANGASAAGVYTNNIVALSPFLNPPNAFRSPANPGITIDHENTADYAARALTSGDLTFTRRAVGLISSHELGHTLSLRHVATAGSVTQNGGNPIMGTPAIDAPIQVLVEEAEFSLAGTNPGELPGEAPFNQNDVAQLAGAIGTRIAAGETGTGIGVNARDNARLLNSTFLNNTISGTREDGIAIVMNDNAVAEGVTIQGNTITSGSGNGVRLEANGSGTFIDADTTIGGNGVNVLGGTSFNQSNLISDNGGDGFRALAANGGTIHGNLINNSIINNGGNGAALLIDNGGFIDFGTVASNRVIRDNTITGNGGAGILLNQSVSPTNEAQLDATILGNEVSGNQSGGIVAGLNGDNNIPPAPPALVDNNRLNLVIGGSGLNDNNVLDGNDDVGIAVNVTGTGKANVDITNTSITGTTDGGDPLLNGDGINLKRADSSLLTVNIDDVASLGNEGDGLDVETQGNDKFDPNQPMSGTPNIVTVTNSNFSSNGRNGARFRTFGDSTLIGDLSQSTFSNNGEHGISVHTSENSSFGDPTIGLPPGRRSVFESIFAEENGIDGVHILATEESRALVEITANALPNSSDAHAAAQNNGATSISRNASDGVHIETTGGRSDILITSGSETTTIDGNGTQGGGNGIRWDSSNDAEGVVRVTRTEIINNIAGLTEDTATNGNGVLDPGEDLNGNGALDPGEDTNANQDVDVADGDGIQANFQNDTTSTLIVGNVGEGNVIQNNGDDGIAITTTGRTDLQLLPGGGVSPPFGNPRPIITITDNTIGGTRNGLDAGNTGDGVSMNVIGGTAVGVAPANVDFTLPGLTFNDGVTETGAVPQFTMTNNLVSNNGRRGANFQLTGANGTRDREFGLSTFDPVRITLDDNTIVSNGEEGVLYRADADMNQSRFVYLANFPDPPITGNDNQNFSPFRPEFFALNIGSVNGNTSYAAPYLNLRTVQNSFLTLTNNTIQNNGVNTVTGEGVRIDVSTGAYVAADIRGNTMGGNLEEDLVTSSFLAAGNTFDSVDNNGDLTFDFIYLDDTAQLDMRFQDNSGNQIAPSDAGALYTNADPLKTQFFGAIGVQQREASFFQVDNGPNLNNPNNTFINFGVTQDIQAAFTNGDYNLRGAADPLFPNIGFAPFLP